MQNRLFKTIIIKAVFLMALFTTLFAFTIKPTGGDSYEIFYNNKQLLKQAILHSWSPQDLSLPKAASGDRLVVYYHHCGVTGKNRSISLRDKSGRVLRKWDFANAGGKDAGMSIDVNDLMKFAGKNGKVQLYYASAELPQGRVLANLNPDVTATAWHQRVVEPGLAAYILVCLQV